MNDQSFDSERIGPTTALIGNPNCGKTTLFNALTGTHQKVGNWPGVTVERKSGEMTIDGATIEIVDLPGIYSIEQDHLALDEQIARTYLASQQTDLVINIVDANNIERNLILTQQVLETGLPTIVVVNMLDVAAQQGISVDIDELQARLGVRVLPLVASRHEGLEELRAELEARLEFQPESREAPASEPASTTREGEGDGATGEILLRRYHRARELTDGVVVVESVHDSLTERLDRWVLNRVLGIPVFLLMMYLTFTLAINLGAVFIDFFDILFAAVLVDGTTWALQALSLPDWIVVLLADGLGGGITLVATFIPVIGFLYLCLSLLEDSGYMSRAAFVVDRVMQQIGLPGNAFVPLIVGFGCNVPSVMATRTLGRDSDRLLTIAMAPFMSCGARLTVYALFAAAFFTENGQNIVFLLYLLGIFMAVMTGWIFRKQLFSDEIAPSFQEMPAYHLPVARNILLTTWFRLKSFCFRAGKNIVMVVMVLSVLNSMGVDGTFGHKDSENSVLSVIGKSITPLFEPMGLTEDNWPATVGLFTGMFAKEAVVGTLDALYSEPDADASTADGPPDIAGAVGDAVGSVGAELVSLADSLTDPLGISIGDVSDQAEVAASQGVATSTLSNMVALFVSPFAAFTYLVFILLYAPCVAVLGTIAKEAGWGWTAVVFSWSTGLAYYTATGIYQVGNLVADPVYAGIWLVSTSTILYVAIRLLRRITERTLPTGLIPVVEV